MLIITKNGQITGIEKQLLNTLDIDLHRISDFVNTVELQLSSINSDPLNINGKLFQIKKIELASTDDINLFNLDPLSEDNITTSEYSYNFETEETLPEPKLIEESHYTAPEMEEKFSEVPEKEPEEKENLIQNTEDLILIPQEEETPNEPEPDVLNIGLIDTADKETDYKEEKVEEPEHQLNIHEEKIEFEIPHGTEETKESELTIPEEENVIEISFEDDLEEIRNILSKNKDEFNSLVASELKKASEELGIEYEELVNWYNQLIEQIKDEKSSIYKFIKDKDYTNLHESYHKLKGAALNLRLSQIALILKKLDELSKKGEDIEKIKLITDDFYKILENESVNIDEKQSTDENSKPADKYIEKIVLKTIQSYLNNQNETQFQKDKKYIEKLLNTKINSIEDLQKLIKGL
jgi:HPt (histidine-containing phosphotransfer) domain-containing protein